MQWYIFGANKNLDAMDVDLVSGKIGLYDSTGGSVGILTFGSPAFGVATGGEIVANAIASDTSSAGGTISYGDLLDSLNNPYMRLSVSTNDSTSDTDLKISSLTIPEGETIKVNAGNFTAYYDTID